MSGFDLAGKVIVVTGASSGIGRASAVCMGALGAHMVLVARDADALGAAVAEIRAAGGVADQAVADVSQRDEILAALDRAEQIHGRIDGLFANAGGGGATAPFVDYPDDAFDSVLDLNVKSVFWAMKRVLPPMIARRGGAILVTGSLASERGLPLTAGYNASKHAVLGLMRSAAAETARHNVRVNAILPGLIETRMLTGLADKLTGGDVAAGLSGMGAMTPMRRIGSPEETASVAAFLMSDAASYVTGQAWAVDGGVLASLGNGG